MRRRPIGYVNPDHSVCDVGDHFAHIAQLEAATVLAFSELAQQLKIFGAPDQLVRRCISAATDEVRHAHAFVTLAKEMGATIPPITQDTVAPDILSVAIHNAVEGCVFETWAALTTHHQSIHCKYPFLNMLYAEVAADETRHGQLAWDLHTWFMSHLNKEEQRHVITAQRKALNDLISMAETQIGHPAFGGLNQGEARTMTKAFAHKLSA